MSTLARNRSWSDLWVSSWITLGFAMAFIGPSLLNAWELPVPLVIGGMLIPPAIAIMTLFFVWPPRNVTFHKIVVTAIFTFVALLLFELKMTGDASTQNVKQVATNGVIFFLIDLLAVGVMVLAASGVRRASAVETIVQCLYTAAIAVSVLQIVALVMGVTNPLAKELAQQGDEALLLKALGIAADRVTLPFSGGFQAGAIAPLVTAIIAAAKVRRGAVLHISMLIFGLVPILILDARQFVLALIFVAICRTGARAASLVATAGIFAPTVGPLMVAIAQSLPGLASAISSRSDKFGMLSGRQFIWNQFSHYWNMASFDQHLIGNGIYGQVVAGISARYEFMFSGWSEKTRPFMLLHNSYIQSLADGGIVSLIIWVTLIGATVYRTQVLSKRAAPEAREAWGVVNAVVLAFAFIGSTETIMTIYLKEAVPVWLGMFLIVAIYGGRRAIPRPVVVRRPEILQERLEERAI